jgi:transforming growth factor-beta-induced protein
MQSSPFVRRFALMAVLALTLAACGSDAADTTDGGDSPATTMTEDTMTEDTMTATTMTEDTMTEDSMADTMAMLTTVNAGAACGAVPADGEGSFAGMADDPAATAASNNPVLSTLVEAVGVAGLVDTLNGEGPFTIFAPTNDAFAAIPEADLSAILADTELLTSILTYHVVGGESLDMAELAEAGTVATVNGAELTIAEGGDLIEINGTAMAVCGNVQTANATVHIIDAVLVP